MPAGQAAGTRQELGTWPFPAPSTHSRGLAGAWRLREPGWFMQPEPGPECKSRQVQSNRGCGHAGACSPSADVARRWHKPPLSCSSCPTAAGGGRKQLVAPGGFTHKSLFIHPLFSPVPSSQLGLGLQLGHTPWRLCCPQGRAACGQGCLRGLYSSAVAGGDQRGIMADHSAT